MCNLTFNPSFASRSSEVAFSALKSKYLEKFKYQARVIKADKVVADDSTLDFGFWWMLSSLFNHIHTQPLILAVGEHESSHCKVN